MALPGSLYLSSPFIQCLIFAHVYIVVALYVYCLQLLWGGRWQDGAAAGSGEDMELLFSYLSRLNLITKNMSAASKSDINSTD